MVSPEVPLSTMNIHIPLALVGLTLGLSLGCGGTDTDTANGGAGAGSGGEAASGGVNTGGQTNSGGSATGGVVEGSGGTGGTPTAAIGDACTDSRTCPPIAAGTAGVCKLDWSGGYCTGNCVAESDCGAYSSCREENAADPEGAALCLHDCGCETCTPCRSGYECILGECIPE